MREHFRRCVKLNSYSPWKWKALAFSCRTKLRPLSRLYIVRNVLVYRIHLFYVDYIFRQRYICTMFVQHTHKHFAIPHNLMWTRNWLCVILCLCIGYVGLPSIVLWSGQVFCVSSMQVILYVLFTHTHAYLHTWTLKHTILTCILVCVCRINTI